MNIQEYSVALATSFESNKNSSAMAREIGVHQSTTSRFLKALDLNDRDFVPLVRCIFGKKKLDLVIDDGTISRRYSQEVEGTSSMVDQSTKTFTTGYKIVVSGLTHGKYFLPIAIEQWIAKFIAEDSYFTITKLAEKLIVRVLELGISIAHFVMDGLRCVLFSYCLLQILMKKFKLNCIEDAIRKAQALKNKYGFFQTIDRIRLVKFA